MSEFPGGMSRVIFRKGTLQAGRGGAAANQSPPVGPDVKHLGSGSWEVQGGGWSN